MTERRTNHLALFVVEAHRQRTTFEHGCERLSIFKRVAARDLHIARWDLCLNSRRRLDLVIEHDDDLALIRRKFARSFGEFLRAFSIELDVDRVIRTGLRRFANGNAFDVLTSDERRIGARLNRAILRVLPDEGIAESIAISLMRNVIILRDSLPVCFVRERISAGELQLTGLANSGECALRIGKTRDLNEDLIVSLNLNRSFRSTERIDARLDDLSGRLHLLRGDLFPIGALSTQDHRKTTTDIETLIDLL